MRKIRSRVSWSLLAGAACLGLAFLAIPGPAGASVGAAPAAAASRSGSAIAAFRHASAEMHVPTPLLEAMCYFEGRLSMNGGRPSIDHGYGCMNLMTNDRADTLGQAAGDLRVGVRKLETSFTANVLGGAAVLRDTARMLSPSRALPASLAGWYGAVAAYEHPVARSAGLMFGNAVYALLRTGFTGRTDTGERVALAPQHVRPDTAAAARVHGVNSALPSVCKNDPSAVDYPGAVDCIVPKSYNCEVSKRPYPHCTYNGADRPKDYAVNGIITHDVEGTAVDAINVFWDRSSGVSVNYVVGTDGTVYQTLREKNISFGDGNYWSNEHTVQIEHAGWDATGWQWYNAAEYHGSAKLVTYLVKKYHLRLDRTDILAHGTVPPENPGEVPVMHVDPGPYWLWDYYFRLIHRHGVPYPAPGRNSHVIAVQPSTDQRPFGRNGAETSHNFNFFYLYNGPSTASGLIPQLGDGTDVTDESDNLEPAMNYFYLKKVKDPAGTGDTLYEVWYGESDKAHASPPNYTQHAKLAWLAVPPGDRVVRGDDTAVALTSPGGGAVTVYGDPISSSAYHLGTARSGSVFASGGTLREDFDQPRPGRLWYEINFNHRQAYVPASSVTAVHAAGR